MIYRDILNKTGIVVRDEIKRVLNLALQSQHHPGDLLLVKENGFYDPKILTFQSGDGKKYNPHVVGPNSEGHSEATHYDFIHHYRTTNYSEKSSTEYFQSFVMEVWDKEKSERNDILTKKEELSIHLEMLVYLKIWEADMFIKRLYQLIRLLNGESYDWYFKIQESARGTDSTGSRQDLIRKKIRDRIKKTSPILFDIIKHSYKTQIRNSIAHSNFSLIGRSIQLNNYIENDPASQLHTVSFEEWAHIFHNSLILYSEYIGMLDEIDKYYINIASKHANVLPVLVTEKDGGQYELSLEYRPQSNSWGYKQNQ